MLTRSNIIAFLAYSRRWESKTKKIFQISKKLLKKCREVYSNLNVREDLLYFDSRIVVPRCLQMETLQTVHAQMHFGQARTLQLLRRSFFWIGLARDARTHCSACITCQRAKPSRKPKEPLARRSGRHGCRYIALGRWGVQVFPTRCRPLLTPRRNYSSEGPDSQIHCECIPRRVGVPGSWSTYHISYRSGKEC